MNNQEQKLRATLTDMVCDDQLVSFVQETVSKQLGSAKKVVVKIPNKKDTETVGLFHESFPTVLQCVASKQNVALIGPTGSGKTTMGQQVADALGLKFYFNGAIQHEHKLVGFVDAKGVYVPTPFYEAFVNGGVYMFDEYDASGSQAILAFNAALANGMMDFPNGMKDKHPDCYIMASLNTWGQGRDREYVGRNKMDSASMDRFTIQIEMPYDEALERMIAPNAEWTDYVQAARLAIGKLGIRHIVSPRVSITGATLLEGGMKMTQVKKLCLWKGLPEGEIKKVEKQIKSSSPSKSKDELDVFGDE